MSLFDKYSSVDWGKFPEHTRQSLVNFVEHGIPAGGFLEAVLTNDLRGAVRRADRFNIQQLWDITEFCLMNIPAGCWGSRQAYNNWIKLGGLDKILGTDRGNYVDDDDTLGGTQRDGIRTGEDGQPRQDGGDHEGLPVASGQRLAGGDPSTE